MDKAPLIKNAAINSSLAYDDLIGGVPAIINELTGMAAFYLCYNDLDIFVFRGTQEPRDWLFNLTALPPIYSEGAWYHAGFLAAYKSISDRLLPSFNPNKTTLITGHSLGGVLAERMAASCKGDDVHLITFGKPNLRFKPKRKILTHLKTQISVINGSDAVARVPKFLFGPDPGQTILYFPNSGGMIMGATRQDLKNDWHALDTASDHSMDLYLSKLWEYL